MSDSSKNQAVSRRRIVKGLALTGASGLAGCAGWPETATPGGGNGTGNGTGDGDDDAATAGEAGERVPTIELEYWSDMGSMTVVFENSIPGGIKKATEEALGIKVEPIPVAFMTQIGNFFGDERTAHIGHYAHTMSPDRLDPHEWVWRYNLTWAGANGKSNSPNYANCNHTVNAYKQSVAPSRSKRKETLNNALAQQSEDIAMIPTCGVVRFGAADTTEVELGGVGTSGLLLTSSIPLIKSSAKGDNSLVANLNPNAFESRIYQTTSDTQSLAPLTNTIYSPLVGYNEDWEQVNVLAKNYEVSNGGKQVTFELRDATFHNGEPITGEDVAFTFEWLSNNYTEFPHAAQLPIESFDTSEKSVTFNLSTPFPPLITRSAPKWGILPKDHYVEQGAREDPSGFDLDPIIGSGPYKVTNFEKGSQISTEPHDGHPVYSPDSNLIFRSYQDSQSAARSFKSGPLNMFQSIPAGIAQQLKDRQNANVVKTEGFANYLLYPQMQFGPFMSRPMRLAFSQAMNRKLINASALYGESWELEHSIPITKHHPWFPDTEILTDIMPSPEGDAEAAKQTLKDAGFTWDDQGRLRYPSDIDLTPKWSKGKEPKNMPEKFPCVEEEPLKSVIEG